MNLFDIVVIQNTGSLRIEMDETDHVSWTFAPFIGANPGYTTASRLNSPFQKSNIGFAARCTIGETVFVQQGTEGIVVNPALVVSLPPSR